MKSFKLIFSFGLLLCTLHFACKKSEGNKSGTFSFTKVNGKTYSTSYVDTAIPSKNGTFSLQYQKNGTSGTRWMFFVLVDNNNDLGLDIVTPGPIVNGTSYTSSTVFSSVTEVSFYGMLDNVSLNVSKTTVVFEKSTYPGQIIGTFSAYGSSNNLIGTGKFDFVAK